MGRKVTFSMSPNADVTVKDIEKNGARGMSFKLVVDGDEQKVEIKIVGLHHVYNAMARPRWLMRQVWIFGRRRKACPRFGRFAAAWKQESCATERFCWMIRITPIPLPCGKL